MTVAEALRAAALRLRDAGVPQPELDAETLLRHVLGWDRARLLAHPESAVPADAAARYDALIAERAKRRPLQHLTSVQAFWRHEFLVTPEVLIPRPETELLVETALELLRGVARPVVVDVGRGSGCIALSLAAERPDAEIHATDLSEPALAVARENARRLGLAGRVEFHCGDLLGPVAHLAGRVDLIACNLPYVEPAGTATLAPEVRDHEPASALFPPEDRYSIYRALIPWARSVLAPRGRLVLEIGAGMEEAVSELLGAAGFAPTASKRDLAGRRRVLFGATA